ncbi:putative inactive purple acid phosphatase 16 isoform X5 [Tasmannia lanceolata]|uniref:putative inactive purple acid phosphatase 16 isoform X5 n=1 Tax=Tasmannia lanceolata TaxID=3420 RepID=UPI0040646368
MESPFSSHYILLELLLSFLFFSTSTLQTVPEKTLGFSSDSSFKISLFADLHYGEDAWTEWGPQQDVNSNRVMSNILDTETPDFVVYLGDVLTANNLPIPNASLYWDEAISPTRQRGIPWASVFGNHDDAHFEWPSEWFSGTGIPQLYCPPTCSSEVVSNAQASWFQNKSQEINPDSRVPEIILWHIPSRAYKKVAPMFRIRKPCVGSINKESVAAQEAEWGIMNSLVKRPSVKAVFSGHNHGLDWCCPYKKLWLCFARHTGYGGYGNWPRGARIIEITEHPFSLKSWIRMEDGFKHSEVVLSP